MSVHARIGLPGSLLEVPGVSALSHTPERLTSRRVTLGGRRVTQEAAREHRTWEVELRPGSAARDVAALAALAAGEWGRGPFAFVSEWAQVTNVLTPRASVLDLGASPVGTMVGGPLILADGNMAGRHLTTTGPVTFDLPVVDGTVERVPIVGGVDYTASIYTTGPCTMQLRYYNAAGTVIGTGPIVDAPAEGAPRRISTTSRAVVNAPATAAIRIVASAAGCILARPALTWTPTLLPWYPGQGVNTVTVEGLSTEVLHAWAGEGGQRAGYSFTVVEVG